ncbi:MAG: sigma-54 interaction domain-containing protein [Lentisphaeria bacterium]
MWKGNYEKLELLNRIALLLAEAKNRNLAIRQILDWLEKQLQLLNTVAILNDNDNNHQFVTSSNSTAAQLSQIKLNYNEINSAMQSGKSTCISSKKFHSNDQFHNQNVNFLVIVINHRDEILGTLCCYCSSKNQEAVTENFAYLHEITKLIGQFITTLQLQDSYSVFVHAQSPGGAFDKLVGNSPAIKEVKKMAAKVADSPTTVLIQGETGTGKGVIAEVIHNLSPRKNNPFIEVNCGAIPESLIESELFGHERGAFTGAITHRIGIFERAGNGTVFLDEIGELPLPLQTRLLRVLQTKKFERIGGAKTLNMNARIIAATNRNLEDDINNGTFRQDLYFRISAFPITMPSLHQRGKAEVTQLLDYFAQKFSKTLKIQIYRFDTPAIDMLTAYHWPGNVRELENVVERAVLLSDDGVIRGHHLPPSLQMRRYQTPTPSLKIEGNFDAQVIAFEIQLLTDALKDCSGNMSKAAEQLGLTQRIMQYKVKKYEIDYRKFR